MEKREFTLRKGKVIEKISNSLYVAEDIFTKEKISVTLSGKEIMNGVMLNLGKDVFIVTLLHDLSKGRHYSKNQVRGLNIDFNSLMKKLDNGIDPLKNSKSNHEKSKEI